MSWNYAELSMAAKAAGGPELYALMLKEGGRLLGHADMYPWIAGAAGGGLVVGGVIIYVIEAAKKRRATAEAMVKEGQEGFVRTMGSCEDDPVDESEHEPSKDNEANEASNNPSDPESYSNQD